MCKSESVFFKWFKKNHFSLLPLPEIIYAFSQLFKYFKSELTCLFIFLMEWLKFKLDIICKMMDLQYFIA